MGSTQQTRQVERLLTGGPSAQVARCLRPATPYHSAARLCGLSAHSHPLLLQHEQPTSLQLKRQGTRQHNKHRAGMTPPTPAYHPPKLFTPSNNPRRYNATTQNPTHTRAGHGAPQIAPHDDKQTTCTGTLVDNILPPHGAAIRTEANRPWQDEPKPGNTHNSSNSLHHWKAAKCREIHRSKNTRRTTLTKCLLCRRR